ncbi:MAG TPA: T9SS type A sorting domain-containing protein [Ignavibacteriaceae bacterium]|nr:T9SS type A sorting domain-containing protein [Ignavibacteriaceae bacterium]
MDKNRQHHFKYFILPLLVCFTAVSYSQSLIIDHNCTNLNSMPLEWIDSAKAKLHIAYSHTSHGSQLIDGMNGLCTWKGDNYAFNNGGTNGALDLEDGAMPGDLGNPDYTTWAGLTYDFLKNPSNSGVNVIIWSWCGEASTSDSNYITTYLNLMTALEDSFPSIKFVYMTGHLDGSGVDGDLNQRNEQIRRYCRNNNKILYDFADIESYDPDGNYYLDKMANDNCDYDSDNNQTRDKNWAEDWQNSHILNVDYYMCNAAHSKALNANRKAYAAWWLWASLAGWIGTTNVKENKLLFNSFELYQNYPNPFNPSTNFEFRIGDFGLASLKIYDVIGNEVAVLVNEEKEPGEYKIQFNGKSLSCGVYFYRLTAGKFSQTKKMVLVK